MSRSPRVPIVTPLPTDRPTDLGRDVEGLECARDDADVVQLGQHDAVEVVGDVAAEEAERRLGQVRVEATQLRHERVGRVTHVLQPRARSHTRRCHRDKSASMSMSIENFNVARIAELVRSSHEGALGHRHTHTRTHTTV